MTSSSCSSRLQSLSDLLDVSTMKSHAELAQRYSMIAEALLLNHYLCIECEGKVTDFEIVEIEFYLWLPDVHEDPFCHGHDDQTIPAQWYFHRAGKSSGRPVKPSNAGGYRGGTRKGLDITFGAPITSSFFPVSSQSPASNRIRGGILLRSIRSTDGTLISGPSLIVDEILAINRSRNISELVETKLSGCLAALQPTPVNSSSNTTQSRLYLVMRPPRDPKQNSTLPAIHRSPRVGLDLSHASVTPRRDNPRVQYIGKFYRFFVRPEILKASGRCHTFVGLLVDLDGGRGRGLLSERRDVLDPILQQTILLLSDLMVINKAVIQRYTADFLAGATNKSLAEFVGSNGKETSSNVGTFMRMMGVLYRMGLLQVSPA